MKHEIYLIANSTSHNFNHLIHSVRLRLWLHHTSKLFDRRKLVRRKQNVDYSIVSCVWLFVIKLVFLFDKTTYKFATARRGGWLNRCFVCNFCATREKISSEDLLPLKNSLMFLSVLFFLLSFLYLLPTTVPYSSYLMVTRPSPLNMSNKRSQTARSFGHRSTECERIFEFTKCEIISSFKFLFSLSWWVRARSWDANEEKWIVSHGIKMGFKWCIACG